MKLLYAVPSWQLYDWLHQAATGDLDMVHLMGFCNRLVAGILR